MAASRGGWRSAKLGERREVRVGEITVPYFVTGDGPPAVFVHGALVNANLWREVAGRLSGELTCHVLDLPLGAHTEPLPPDHSVSPPALADLIADTIEAIGLEDVTLVGNDTGGALCQILISRRPERIGRLVLTSCDAFDNFPPKVMRPAIPVLRVPGAIPVLFGPLRFAAVRKRMMTLIRATKRPVPDDAAASYAEPGLQNGAVRRDVRKLLGEADTRYTLEAAEAFPRFEKPVLIAWSSEDSFFPREHAGRLAEAFPDSRLEWIEDARTFSPEDQPQKLAELIGSFVSETTRDAARA
jgi:pimeloyl-ACP methyl ester carboxylesterase